MRKIVLLPELNHVVRGEDGELVDASIAVVDSIVEIGYQAVDVQEIEGSSETKDGGVMGTIEDHSWTLVYDPLLHVVQHRLQ